MNQYSWAVVLGISLALTARASGQGTSAADLFESRVRPVLAEHCFSCHGPKKQMGGVRLDSRQGVLAESDGGRVVVPGDPEKSVMVRAIRHAGELKMPPKGKLPPQSIEAIEAWIKAGAPWPESKAAAGEHSDWKKHWAFRPVRKPPVPEATGASNPVDAFIRQGLAAKGLSPSAPADARALIRRATFDLTGLPPTPQEVEAFVRDSVARPQAAYEALVDRLLASPHYGERWARYWLDVARYADTKGYVFFEESDFPWGYTYRDYVIRAFNEDLPYDRFLLEQLAADRLDLGDDKRPLTALGFLTLGGRFMNNQHDILDDRIDVVTRGLMGLTVTCARCHDHKYDPVPTADYYGLYGVFASCAEPTVPPLFQPPPKTDEHAKFEKQLRDLEAKLTAFVRAKHEELVAGARKRVAEYLIAAHALRDQPSTDEFMLIAEGNDLNPTMVTRWVNYLKRTAKRGDRVFTPWHALAALPQERLAAEAPSLLSELAPAAANPLVVKALAAAPLKGMSDVAQRYAGLLHDVERRGATTPEERELRDVFHGPDAAPNVAMLPYGDLSLLPDRASQAKLQELRKALEKWRSGGPGAPPRAMVVEDLPTPHEPYVFVRGNPNNRGETVTRHLPAVLARGKAEPFKQGSGRLELARFVAGRDNPLTARVLINRVWLHHFGTGLVRTPSDFGLRSDPPSHPELLDYLAATFVKGGWSIKRLHRLLMLSDAYRQRSSDRPECRATDPENRLLWKMPRRRLDFEATRDALLAVAGKLDRRVGGPSVRDPFTPAAGRRTLYSHLDRLNVPGLLRTFDFPSPDATSPQREETTIAPQALFLMNHPLVMACARSTFQRPEVVGEKEAGVKVRRLYRLLFARDPSDEETSVAREYVVGAGNNAAAWERYVHALMQSNEFVWID